MNRVIALAEMASGPAGEFGGKALALGLMHAHGLRVPAAVCVPAEVYREYLRATGLGERILLELSRKPLEEMRWEELWDAALRIRSMFLKTPLPPALETALGSALAACLGDVPTVVRSSAPGEDSAHASFAGLHESYVGVRGVPEVLEHLRLVWASLWSDAALLYRQELGLDVAASAMAVVVQELASGERSGVVFGRSPVNPKEAVVEAVWGLNQGLVDGTVEPDRWTLDRASGQLLAHRPADREQAVRPAPAGVVMTPLPDRQRQEAPLQDAEVSRVFDLARRAEGIFGAPQDVEWTYQGDLLYVLQSRPITTGATGEDDQRGWYLSLRRSFDNLRALRGRIEGELIPALIREGEALAAVPPRGLDDADLAGEVERRAALFAHWHDVYWEEFIPFAHGARLFGQVYNDALRPDDPHEFISLLTGADLASLQRNQRLTEAAALLREDPAQTEALLSGAAEVRGELASLLADLAGELGLVAGTPDAWRQVLKLVWELARAGEAAGRTREHGPAVQEERFLAHFAGEGRAQAEELLDLARASYRLRDDDNIHLGRLEEALAQATAEGQRRLAERGRADTGRLDAGQVAAALRDPGYVPEVAAPAPPPATHLRVEARQLIGQPAGPGIVTGVARVITAPEQLFDFRAGEVLVCDAIEPTMTFVVPLAAGVVERRGGMLIHGAIIAREYGLPCVTGVPQATQLIASGDTVTVDGYLGIVIIERPASGGGQP
jgi:pyruvate,water dikinase